MSCIIACIICVAIPEEKQKYFLTSHALPFNRAVSQEQEDTNCLYLRKMKNGLAKQIF